MQSSGAVCCKGFLRRYIGLDISDINIVLHYTAGAAIWGARVSARTRPGLESSNRSAHICDAHQSSFFSLQLSDNAFLKVVTACPISF